MKNTVDEAHENSPETLASMVGLEIFPAYIGEGGARTIFD